jgi:hypothetical protein
MNVECHAGYVYPGYPTAIVDGKLRYEINRVTAEWHTPDGKKHFNVGLADQNSLELIYDPIQEDWQAIEYISG